MNYSIEENIMEYRQLLQLQLPGKLHESDCADTRLSMFPKPAQIQKPRTQGHFE